MEHEIPFGNSNRENGTTFLDFPLFLGIFQWDEPTKRVPFTTEPEIPEILSKWKAPYIYRLNTKKYVQQCYVKWFWTISSLGAPEPLDSLFVLPGILKVDLLDWSWLFRKNTKTSSHNCLLFQQQQKKYLMSR